jgi:HAD superfamily hydrolase (TIGR01509 family)
LSPGKVRGVKAVSFDADGTLWDFEKTMRHSLQRVLEELAGIDPIAASGLSVEGMIGIRDEVAEEMRGTGARLEEIRLEAFRRTLRESGRPDEGLARRLYDIVLYEDALPALEALRGRYTLGMISNGNSYPERCGLGGFFSFVVLSQECGARKPDPRIFNIALGRAGCSGHEMVHVGDSLDEDVLGASAAGIRSVWINRDQRSETRAGADWEISSLTELTDIL